MFKRLQSGALAALMFLSLAAGLAQAAGQSAPVAPVNINKASAEELATLPGVGPKLAARIVEHRTATGPFKTLEELMNVKGIGEKSFRKLQPHLTLGEPATAAGKTKNR